jgi:hypothetical protein
MNVAMAFGAVDRAKAVILAAMAGRPLPRPRPYEDVVRNTIQADMATGR